MPRGLRVRANLFVKTTPPQLVTKSTRLNGHGPRPRLWNAKRRVKSLQGLTAIEAGNAINKQQTEWWKLDRIKLPQFIADHPDLRRLSPDVKDFLQKGSINLDRNRVYRILRNPARYFSIPHQVPLSVRKQVYFPKPDDSVVLMRTPHLGPRYAAFDVPLHFNKLELKAYLKDVYNVDVLHIRSVIIQQKVDRKEGRNPRYQAAVFRPPSQKKMTCLLAKPFVYPEEPDNLELWENTSYWNSMKEMVRANREDSEWGLMNPDQDHRKAMALQAQQLLKGKTKWAPTWQSFADDRRVLSGLAADGGQQRSGDGARPSV